MLEESLHRARLPSTPEITLCGSGFEEMPYLSLIYETGHSGHPSRHQEADKGSYRQNWQTIILESGGLTEGKNTTRWQAPE